MEGRRLVIAVGQFPPPRTGFSTVTARLVARLARAHAVHPIDIGPGTATGVAKHARRLGRVVGAMGALVAGAGRRDRALYLGCEGKWGLLYTLALVAVARLCRYPITLHHHSFTYFDRRSALMAGILSVGGGRLRHVFLCRGMAARFEAQYRRAVFGTILSNAAFVEPARDDRPGDRPLTIGLLSNLTREKGFDTFIDLLKGAIAAGLDVEGILAGPASPADRAAIAEAARGLAPRLTYLGPVEGEAKAAFFRAIDVFVFPSRYANEAQPLVVFEALAAGKPVLAFDRGCIAGQVGCRGLVLPADAPFVAAGIAWLRALIGGWPEALAPAAIGADFERQRGEALATVEALLE
jgi:glycosyltransferase involved in cell wall biosynthesis